MNFLTAKHFVLQVGLLRDKVASFQEYPFSLPAVRNLDVFDLGPVTFFVGENGSGKSTLLEAIAVRLGLNPEGGSRNFNFSTRESHSELYRCLWVRKGVKKPRDMYFLRGESFFNVATEIEQLDTDDVPGPKIGPAYGERALHEQSHGEAFMALMVNRFRAGGLYLLDEPESALSPQRQLAYLGAMHRIVKGGGQFICATHSPILMAYPGARIYVFGQDGIRETPYEETDHYNITKIFLSRREKMLGEIFAEVEREE